MPSVELSPEYLGPEVEVRVPIIATDLILRRLAGGSDMYELCRDIRAYAAPYPNIEIRDIEGESPFDRPAVDIVDKRGVLKNRLIKRGFTPEGIETEISQVVPSALEPQSVRGSCLGIHHNQLGEYFVELKIDPEEAEQLRREKVAVWAHLAQLGGFDINDLIWLDRAPDIRLAYIDCAGDIVVAKKHARKIGEIVNRHLDLNISLAPVFESDDIQFSYDETMTTTITDELTGRAVQAVTINDLKRFIDESELDFSPQTASRLINAIRDAMPYQRLDIGGIVDNFVAGRVESDLDTQGENCFGIRVQNIPNLIAANVSSISGVGSESAALFHAFTDSLLTEDA